MYVYLYKKLLVFQVGLISLHAHPQYMRVPGVLHVLQDLLWSVIFFYKVVFYFFLFFCFFKKIEV